ncbi:MAG: NeuD/PglB/VioB family sugar acetyltransferase [Bacteroidetes bacterium]|nr:NeuD/PglB/VioB family sugar acetyltransferase [Bacteroidota bacterium]
MKSIVIMGAGGFARELLWLIESLGDWNILGFIRSDPNGTQEQLHGFPSYPSMQDFLSRHTSEETVYYAFGAGSPKVKKSMDAEAISAGLVIAPPLVFPTVHIHSSIQLSNGVVICAGTTLTVDIIVGYGTMLNLHCTVGHDTVIGDFCTFSPGVHLSGNVRVDNNVVCGTNSSVIPNITLGESCVIGAGAAVVKSIPAGKIAVGIPAKVRE